MLTQATFEEAVGGLIGMAQSRPGNRLDLRNEQGVVIATLQVHDVPVRPKDMPRALRPKRKLSKRQRVAAKIDKQRRVEVPA